MAESKQDNYSSTWLNRLGFGQRPALLVIDFMKGYTTEGAPLYAPGVVDAVAEMPELLAAARAAGIPVIHTIVRYSPPHFIDGGQLFFQGVDHLLLDRVHVGAGVGRHQKPLTFGKFRVFLAGHSEPAKKPNR